MATEDTASKRKPAKKTVLRSLDWSLVMFVLALCLFSFSYGLAAMRYNLFPLREIDRAAEAARALGLLQSENFAAGIVRIDEKQEPRSAPRTLDPASGKELLLVTGGPQQDAVHCPKFGCLAWIIDRSGKVLHSWPLPLDTLFGGVEGFTGSTDIFNFYPVGLKLLNDGSLIASFQGRNMYPYATGIARISSDGKVMWKHVDNASHWPEITPDGTILSPVQVRRRLNNFRGLAIPVRCEDEVFDEAIRYYSPDGKPLRTIMLMDVLLKSDYPGLLYGIRDHCDPIHINSIEWMTAEIAEKIPGTEEGDLLVSLREPNAIVILDPMKQMVKRIVIGRTAAQHSAHFLPDGTVIALDNLGGLKKNGGSRIVRINMNDGSSKTIVPSSQNKELLPFFTFDAGHVTVSPDGNRLMISLKDQSRAVEVDIASGKPLWINDRVVDIGPFIGSDRKPVAAYPMAFGTYYVSDEQARGLSLN